MCIPRVNPLAAASQAAGMQQEALCLSYKVRITIGRYLRNMQPGVDGYVPPLRGIVSLCSLGCRDACIGACGMEYLIFAAAACAQLWQRAR